MQNLLSVGNGRLVVGQACQQYLADHLRNARIPLSHGLEQHRQGKILGQDLRMPRRFRLRIEIPIRREQSNLHLRIRSVMAA